MSRLKGGEEKGAGIFTSPRGHLLSPRPHQEQESAVQLPQQARYEVQLRNEGKTPG
jgi:hypothetical protein